MTFFFLRSAGACIVIKGPKMLRNVKVRPLKKAPACEEKERGMDRGLKQNFFYNLYEPNHVLVLADWLSQGQKSGAIRLLDYHQQNGLLLQKLAFVAARGGKSKIHAHPGAWTR